MSLFDVAARAKEMKKRGEITEDLDTKVVTDTPLTFPNGCHIAEVEVDPQTGLSTLASYSALDDSGNILDHTIVAGQVHGSVAMGVGQAMLEQTVYDDGGQLISASFMDYAMPRAHHFPMFKDEVYEVPATTNPLGVKGAGEAGTTAAIAAVMNAFSDAIPGSGTKSRCRRRRRRCGRPAGKWRTDNHKSDTKTPASPPVFFCRCWSQPSRVRAASPASGRARRCAPR